MDTFEDKVAVVTGAASGMGRAFAERFAQEGMKVVLADVEEDALAAAVEELSQREHDVIGVLTDVSSRDALEHLAQEAIATYGKVHVLCNNAGVAVGSPAPVWDAPDNDWQWVFGVNFTGVLNGLQVFVPKMIAHGEPGHIVNTASLAGLYYGGGIYGVTKHAVVALSEALYRDLQIQDSAISASVLCPGFVNTNIMNADRNRPDELPVEAGEDTEEMATRREVGRAMLAQGLPPQAVAELVFTSIRDDRFYILPHPAWDDILRERHETILARGNPPLLDFDTFRQRLSDDKQW